MLFVTALLLGLAEAPVLVVVEPVEPVVLVELVDVDAGTDDADEHTEPAWMAALASDAACRGPLTPLSHSDERLGRAGQSCAAPTTVRRFVAAVMPAPERLCPQLSRRGRAVVVGDLLYVEDERAVLDRLDGLGVVRR